MDEARKPEAHPMPDSWSTLIALWAGVLTGPIIWAVQMQLKFVLVPWVCLHNAQFWMHIISVIALLLTGAAGYTAFVEWRRSGEVLDPKEAGFPPRVRFMSIMGVLISSMFFLTILAQAIPPILLGACQ